MMWWWQKPGCWISAKMPPCQDRKSNYGDKTILQQSYLHNGIFYTVKKTSSYWIRSHPAINRNGTDQVAQNIPLTHLPKCRIYASVKRVSIGSDNVLTPVWRQVIIWTNAHLLSIGPLEENFSEMQSKYKRFQSRKCIWKCRLRNGGHFVQSEMS